MDRKIHRSFAGFQNEILENIKSFDHLQKMIYLNRLVERLNQINSHAVGSNPPKIRFSFDGAKYKSLTEFTDFCFTITKMKKEMIDFVQFLMELDKDQPKNTNHTDLEIKPIINSDCIPSLVGILQQFFTPEHRLMLLPLLSTGDDAPESLIFLGSGNRLADVFKQLYNAGMITGCEKKELEGWIGRNFRYHYRKKNNEFTFFYLAKVISTNEDTCRNPIINVLIEKATGKILIKRP